MKNARISGSGKNVVFGIGKKGKMRIESKKSNRQKNSSQNLTFIFKSLSIFVITRPVKL